MLILRYFQLGTLSEAVLQLRVTLLSTLSLTFPSFLLEPVVPDE